MLFRSYYSGEAKVIINVVEEGEEESGENTEGGNDDFAQAITSPRFGASYTSGDIVKIAVDTSSVEGEVKNVSMFMDGELVKLFPSGPFSYDLRLTNEYKSGNHIVSVIIATLDGKEVRENVRIIILEDEGTTGDNDQETPPASESNNNTNTSASQEL